MDDLYVAKYSCFPSITGTGPPTCTLVEYVQQPSSTETYVKFPIEDIAVGSPEFGALVGATLLLLTVAYISRPLKRVVS